MSLITRPTFHVAGLTIRTTNEAGRAAQDIGALWQHFLGSDLRKHLHTALKGETVYVLYTNYESDYQGFYDVVIGYEVKEGVALPAEVSTYIVPEGRYQELDASGNTMETIPATWHKIWQQDWPRSYQVDYEQYHFDPQEPMRAEAKVYIGVEE